MLLLPQPQSLRHHFSLRGRCSGRGTPPHCMQMCYPGGGGALGKSQGSLWRGIYPGPPGTNLPKGLGRLGNTLSPLGESWPSPEAPFLQSVL